jgi:hypothetical protein
MTKMATVIVISRNPCRLNTSLVWRQTRQIPQTNSRLSLIGRLFLSPSMRWAEQGKYIQPRSNSKSSFGKVTNHPFLNQAGNNKLISIRLEWLLISYLSSRDLTLLKKWTWVWVANGSNRQIRELTAYHNLQILKMFNKDSSNSSLLLHQKGCSKLTLTNNKSTPSIISIV